MTVLLDGNTLVALAVEEHVHHDAAEKWFLELDTSFATCPVTEGTLVRLLMKYGSTADGARQVVHALHDDDRHEFWPDLLSYVHLPAQGVIGHRQVTDAYLAHLARDQKGRLGTFDRGLAQVHGDIADLIPGG